MAGQGCGICGCGCSAPQIDRSHLPGCLQSGSMARHPCLPFCVSSVAWHWQQPELSRLPLTHHPTPAVHHNVVHSPSPTSSSLCTCDHYFLHSPRAQRGLLMDPYLMNGAVTPCSRLLMVIKSCVLGPPCEPSLACSLSWSRQCPPTAALLEPALVSCRAASRGCPTCEPPTMCGWGV